MKPMNCNLCPRYCNVNRKSGERGVCGETTRVRIARASLHEWEEPCISGTKGSGTVFFTGCSLRCVYCQNHNIADGTNGTELTVPELAKVFLRLQEMGAHNINLVTPTHFVPQIAEALQRANALGLRLPVVYNTSGYETAETLAQLDGIINVYLPDMKYYSAALSGKYSGAPDYFEKASAALRIMVEQVGPPKFDEDGLMTSGVIVRHLLLPGCVKDSERVVSYLYKTYGNDIYMSIMRQYTPLSEQLDKYPELNRKVTDEEYEALVDYAADLGVTQAFVQEAESASESFIPDFVHFNLPAFLGD